MGGFAARDRNAAQIPSLSERRAGLSLLPSVRLAVVSVSLAKHRHVFGNEDSRFRASLHSVSICHRKSNSFRTQTSRRVGAGCRGMPRLQASVSRLESRFKREAKSGESQFRPERSEASKLCRFERARWRSRGVNRGGTLRPRNPLSSRRPWGGLRGEEGTRMLAVRWSPAFQRERSFWRRPCLS